MPMSRKGLVSRDAPQDVGVMIARAQKRLDWSAIALTAAADELEQARALGALVDATPVRAEAESVAALVSEMAAARELAASPRRSRDVI
jgi:replicative DNA helicase